MLDIRRLDLNLLLLLDGLLECGNLSMSARRLGVSQPSASAGLSKLRHFFKDELFVRTGRGLRPTPFALNLKTPVRLVVETVNHDILRQPAFDPLTSDRQFTLAMPDLGEVIFLPPIVGKLRAEAPQVSLRCCDVPYADICDALDQGEVDLAIGFFPDLMEPAVLSELLYGDRFVCIVRDDGSYLGDEMSLEDFHSLQHITVEDEGRLDDFENWIGRHGGTRRTLLRIPHFMSIPRLVAASDLMSLVPLSLANALSKQYGLRVLAPPLSLPGIEVKQFWHRRIQNEPGVVWLRGIVSEVLSGKGPGDAA